MVAVKRKKRLNSASGVSYTSLEQNNIKRKKRVSPQCNSSIRSNITLEWDDKEKSVVAKKEQVGIAERDLLPYIDAVPSCHTVLADVVNIPRGTFELENLTEVLSFEVWETHLSEEERSFLTQFLPKGFVPEQVVQELLEGDNFHFGNPFTKWSASLCSGDLHPDIILKKELLLKASNRLYCSELQNYHHDMIRDLQILKERWSQKDHNNDIEQDFWRLREHAEKTLAVHADESTLHDCDNNHTSESFSSATDDKTCSSDELNCRSLHEDSQMRKGFGEDTYDNASNSVKVVPRQGKREKLQNCNFESGDGAKYMSYIKVSKEQHQRVKSSMKQYSNSIQPRSLNHVLGDLGTYCVQPYKVFEEKERQKLHEHWSKLANVDVAVAFTNLRSRQIEKWQLIHAIGQEMIEKVKNIKEDGKKTVTNMLNDQVGDEKSDSGCSTSIEDEEEEFSNRLLKEKLDNADTSHESSTALEDDEHESSDCVFQQQSENAAAINEAIIDDETKSVSTLAQNHHLQHNTILGSNHVYNTVDLVSDENHVMPEPDVLLPNISKFTEHISRLDVPQSHENPLSVISDAWPEVSMPDIYYNSTHVSHEYASVSELSHGPSHVSEEHPTQLINLKPDMRKVDPNNNFLCRQSDDIFLGLYPNQVQNEQFQSLFKGIGSVQYHIEQKPTMLDLQAQASVMIENSQGVGHFREQLHPSTTLDSVMIENSQGVGHFREQLHPSTTLDLRQKRPRDSLMHQRMQENMYLDGLRHALPRQDQFSSPLASSIPNMQSWGANSIQLPGLSQSHSNGGELLSQNWVPVENQGLGGWFGIEPTVGQNQSFVDRSVADQNLFSVLSQCGNMNLSVGLPLTSLAPQEHFNPYMNYSGRVVPATSIPLPQMVNQKSYLNGNDGSNGLKPNNTGWISLPHQNTTLHDSMGKPYSRYWNQ